MQQLSAEGQRLVSELPQRHGFSADAVSTLIYAVLQGNGTTAKLSHPELAGAGQWTPGDRAKGRVDALCKEITTVLAQDPGPLQPGHLPSCTQEAAADQSEGRAFGQSRLFVPVHWWPEELGTPSATGTQNNVRYAYFADTTPRRRDRGRGLGLRHPGPPNRRIGTPAGWGHIHYLQEPIRHREPGGLAGDLQGT